MVDKDYMNMLVSALVPPVGVAGALYTLGDNYFQLRRTGKEMREYGVKPDNLDDYYHTKAHYEAARYGPVGFATAQGVGLLKELFDVPKNALRRMLATEIKDDFIKDLTNNGIGGISGLLREQDAVKDRKTNSMAVLDIVKALKNK